MSSMRGKSLRAITYDISEGYLVVNPIFLKPLDDDSLKELYHEIMRAQSEIRAEKFPYSDSQAIRRRNMRLQRLHQASIVIKNFARERKLILF
ncbi:MAG: hypothetical protein QMC83_09515 [Thermodesulfovibrionales bacterium]|nr:hypothetical protein [Thermodesulfovibrionales bacterium]